MFSRNNGSPDKDGPVVTGAKPAAPSIVSTDLVISGDLVSEGEVHIDGTVEGDVKAKSVLVGEAGIIRGEVIADSVRVHGAVDGQINARSVSLARSAKVSGDILHEMLSIEQGAFLEGHCRRITDRKDGAEGRLNLVVKDGAEGSADTEVAAAGAPPQSPRSDANPGPSAATTSA